MIKLSFAVTGPHKLNSLLSFPVSQSKRAQLQVREEGEHPLIQAAVQCRWPLLYDTIEEVGQVARSGDPTFHPGHQWQRNASCCRGRSGQQEPQAPYLSLGTCQGQSSPFGQKGHREIQGRAAVPPSAAKRRVWLSSHFRHDTLSSSVRSGGHQHPFESPVTFHSTEHPHCSPETERQWLSF